MRGAVGEGLGCGQDAELGGVGLAEEHEACLAELAREVCVLWLAPAQTLQERHALVKWIPGGVAGEILQQHRHAAEGPVGQRRTRCREGALGQVGDDRVQQRIQRVDASERVLDELAWRDLAGSHQLGLVSRVAMSEVRHHPSFSSCARRPVRSRRLQRAASLAPTGGTSPISC